MKYISKIFNITLIITFLIPPLTFVRKSYIGVPEEMKGMTSYFERKVGVDLTEAKVELVNLYLLDIRFLLIGAVGFCDIKNETIYIHKPYWDNLNHWSKEMLLFHEYGHCYMNLRHIKYLKGDLYRRNVNDCPMTLMYPSMFHPECYRKNRDFYLETLKFHFEVAKKEAQFPEGE